MSPTSTSGGHLNRQEHISRLVETPRGGFVPIAHTVPHFYQAGFVAQMMEQSLGESRIRPGRENIVAAEWSWSEIILVLGVNFRQDGRQIGKLFDIVGK